jgi:hypothetical protein
MSVSHQSELHFYIFHIDVNIRITNKAVLFHLSIHERRWSYLRNVVRKDEKKIFFQKLVKNRYWRETTHPSHTKSDINLHSSLQIGSSWLIAGLRWFYVVRRWEAWGQLLSNLWTLEDTLEPWFKAVPSVTQILSWVSSGWLYFKCSICFLFSGGFICVVAKSPHSNTALRNYDIYIYIYIYHIYTYIYHIYTYIYHIYTIYMIYILYIPYIYMYI